MFSAQVTPQLCDYCHQQPKFSGYKYCSKTCASSAGGAAPATAAGTNSASSLCDYCQSKPKFTNFDYCGKYCAAQAAVQSGTSQPTQGAQQASQGFNPMQMAQTLAQQFPQVKTYFAQVNPQTGQVAPVPATTANQGAATANSGVPTTAQQSLNGSSQPAVPTNVTCLIPGCGKPVHVDSKGAKTSDYCSQRHREEAVTSGVAEACIKCHKYPQSDKDYFCSRACKEEALKKN